MACATSRFCHARLDLLYPDRPPDTFLYGGPGFAVYWKRYDAVTATGLFALFGPGCSKGLCRILDSGLIKNDRYRSRAIYFVGALPAVNDDLDNIYSLIVNLYPTPRIE